MIDSLRPLHLIAPITLKSMTVRPMLILLSCISILMSSCKNDDLSRPTAETLIKENVPNAEIRPFVVQTGLFDDKYDALRDKGVITHHYSLPYTIVDLTEEGKRYAVTEKYNPMNGTGLILINVRTANLAFGEITGIVQSKESNTAKVDYTLVRKEVTPFGSIWFELKEGPFENSATFTKYDDGWRIDK